MLRTLLRQQMVPLAILVILVLVELSTLLVANHTKRTYRVQLRVQYERVMRRVDAAIESISATMTREGLAADFAELLRQASPGDLKAAFESESEAPRERDFVLTGVMWNPRVPLAFLNGKLVGVGDRIGPAEVIHVGKESLVLRMEDGEERTLVLEETGVR